MNKSKRLERARRKARGRRLIRQGIAKEESFATTLERAMKRRENLLARNAEFRVAKNLKRVRNAQNSN